MGLFGWCEGKCHGSPTKETSNNEPLKKLKGRNNEQQSYSGKRLLSDMRTNADAAIEKNDHVTILLEFRHLYQGR